MGNVCSRNGDNSNAYAILERKPEREKSLGKQGVAEWPILS
jgi:hypothetical protein